MSQQADAIIERPPQSLSLRFITTIRHGVLDDLVTKLGSIRALAKELGLCEQTVSGWVNLRSVPRFEGGEGKGPWGKEKSRRVVLKLCELTGKRIDEIFPDFSYAVIKGMARKVVRDAKLSQAQAEEMLARKDAGERRQLLPDPSSEAAKLELSERVKRAIKTLSYREREVIKLRYGLDDGLTYTQAEIGLMMKVTKERVSQIEAKAIRKMQQPSRSMELIGCLD